MSGTSGCSSRGGAPAGSVDAGADGQVERPCLLRSAARHIAETGRKRLEERDTPLGRRTAGQRYMFASSGVASLSSFARTRMIALERQRRTAREARGKTATKLADMYAQICAGISIVAKTVRAIMCRNRKSMVRRPYMPHRAGPASPICRQHQESRQERVRQVRHDAGLLTTPLLTMTPHPSRSRASLYPPMHSVPIEGCSRGDCK